MKATIIGIGESGRAAALFLKKTGADVYATDSGNSTHLQNTAQELRSCGINVELGKHSKDFIKDSKLVVVSPGVGDESPGLKFAKELNKEIISEIELGFRHCRGKIIAVTGTNGKSTTVTLIAQILKDAGKDVVLCGNIGKAFCSKIEKISENTIVVLEVSSFQLKFIKTFKPHISVILNISQNHLDAHSDLENYFSAKRRIYQYQDSDDYLVLNYDDINLKNLKNKPDSKVLFFSINEKVKGAFAKESRLFLNIETLQEISKISTLKLTQPHNIGNFLAASICASLFGVPTETIKNTIATFKGLKHRIELVATINDVDFIDDSKATTVDATVAALRSRGENIILIAGGRNKGSNFRLAGEEIKKRVKTLILIGEATNQMKEELSGSTETTQAHDMNEAVNIASKLAQAGDTVLLSPMCASFDMYKDYKARGDAFVAAVNTIEKK